MTFWMATRRDDGSVRTATMRDRAAAREARPIQPSLDPLTESAEPAKACERRPDGAGPSHPARDDDGGECYGPLGRGLRDRRAPDASDLVRDLNPRQESNHARPAPKPGSLDHVWELRVN